MQHKIHLNNMLLVTSALSIFWSLLYEYYHMYIYYVLICTSIYRLRSEITHLLLYN